ncbi:MAG: heme o synthase [Herminiimonas sp.]|uniref:heme o synthase n=1 Tax=Herminiimonas sp. TaxID=1926289 RepID=UPI00271DF618|nr:heme o synthase [Herminiimonas sp.]MDO9422469.1 heme o synthase [Herminiimonas sp.]
MNELTLRIVSEPRWKQFWALTKPRVVQMIVFCSFIGMMLAIPSSPSGEQCKTIAFACIGIWLVASAAAALNCLIEKSIDAKMQRTAWRPTARGELPDMHSLVFAVVLCCTGILLLAVTVNLLTSALTAATFAGYAIVYTVVLKPLTPQNIVIGGASGAMPPLLGWVAMRGEVGVEAVLLFLIIFVWTPPHFWALALYRVEDYKKSGLPMLPVTHGMKYTTRTVFIYTLVLLAVTMLPFILGMASWIYLTVAFSMGLIFCIYGYRLWANYSDSLARNTFKWSLWHLSGVFLTLLVDHYV